MGVILFYIYFFHSFLFWFMHIFKIFHLFFQLYFIKRKRKNKGSLQCQVYLIYKRKLKTTTKKKQSFFFYFILLAYSSCTQAKDLNKLQWMKKIYKYFNFYIKIKKNRRKCLKIYEFPCSVIKSTLYKSTKQL